MSKVSKAGPVIAVDGPAGAGKSTLARRVAEALGLPYLNTGLMYRALARTALDEGISPSDGEALAGAAGGLRFSMAGTEPRALLLDGESPGSELLGPDVEAVVSEVSSHPAVREIFRREQRRLSSEGAVVEGRDIGSVVFPDADLKVLLVGDAGERARRRQEERGGVDPELAGALRRRDELDSRVNPFVPAPDAEVVDTTGRSADEVFELVYPIAARALGRAASGR